MYCRYYCSTEERNCRCTQMPETSSSVEKGLDESSSDFTFTARESLLFLESQGRRCASLFLVREDPEPLDRPSARGPVQVAGQREEPVRGGDEVRAAGLRDDQVPGPDAERSSLLVASNGDAPAAADEVEELA